jgi:hypothetical protein
LVELDYEGRKIVPRALRNYWGEYLQTTTSDEKKEKADSSACSE